MGRAVVEALVLVSTKSSYTIKLYCSSAFPCYYPADGTVKTDEGRQDVDSMQSDLFRYHWCIIKFIG
jgi:hypothetical protein